MRLIIKLNVYIDKIDNLIEFFGMQSVNDREIFIKVAMFAHLAVHRELFYILTMSV